MKSLSAIKTNGANELGHHFAGFRKASTTNDVEAARSSGSQVAPFGPVRRLAELAATR